MLPNYDMSAAREYVLRKLHEQKALPPEISEELLEGLILRIQQLDIAYMQRHGIDTGDAYYDDDDAFEEISDALIEMEGVSEDAELPLCDLVDAYLEIHQLYLESAGLLEWE